MAIVNEVLIQMLALLRRALLALAGVLGAIARSVWSVLRAPALFALNVLAALIVLFEEWGWRPLSALLARLAKYRPWAAVERAIAKAPPYAALCIFALPTTLLLPLKLVAMWLLAKGMVASATALFVGAKIASTALIARIFLLTKPALMRIAWFAAAYEWFTGWKEYLFGIIRASPVWRWGRRVKAKVKRGFDQALARARPVLAAQFGTAVLRVRAWASLMKARLFGRSPT